MKNIALTTCLGVEIKINAQFGKFTSFDVHVWSISFIIKRLICIDRYFTMDSNVKVAVNISPY